MYRPVQVFSRIAIFLFLVGALIWARFLYFYFSRGSASGHVQSLIVGTGAVLLSFVVALVAMLAELLAANRRLLEDLLVRVRGLETRDNAGPTRQLYDVWSTGHASWTPQAASLEARPASREARELPVQAGRTEVS